MKLGIGCGGSFDKIAAGIRSSSHSSDIVCYTTAEFADAASGITFKVSEDPAFQLVKDLHDGVIDGAVRGTLPANATLSLVKKMYGVDHLRRLALLETSAGKKFILAPVGVDEGWTVADKVAFVTEGRKYAAWFGLSDKAVVLAGGREGDLGRHPAVDASIADALEVCKQTGAEFGEILIEDALEKGAGIVVAPDGISGNLIFRTLALLGNGEGHGGPIINLPDVFVDSSRVMSQYTTILDCTARLIELRKK